MFSGLFGLKLPVLWPNSMANILRKSVIMYTMSTIIAVYPLYAASAIVLLTEKEFVYHSCAAAFYNSTQISHLSFNQPCGNIPLVMLSKDYPFEVGSYSSDSTTVCKGIPSGIRKLDGISKSYKYDTVSLQQVVIYFLLGLVALGWTSVKKDERFYIRISIAFGGVCMHSRDRDQLKVVQSKWWNIYNHLPSLSGNWDIVILFGLSIWFLTTLISFPEQTNKVYVVPSNADRNTYKLQFQDLSWCNSLNSGMAVEITYIRYTSTPPPLAVLQAWLFFMTCYNLIWIQRKTYDWIDTDEYMDAKNKLTCVYYNIHQNRDKVFTEKMLNDWLTIHSYYIIGYNILYDEEYITIKTKLEKELLLQKLEILLSDVVEKYNNNPQPFHYLKNNNDDCYSTINGQTTI